MTRAVLETSGLTIGYRHGRRAPHVVASDIDIALAPGELVCLLGPNGAGKSTLLRTLAGIQPPIAGSVRLLGDDVSGLPALELARRLGIVLTERIEVGNLSAYALAALGRHPHTSWTGRLTERDEAVVQWAMTAVGAEHLAARNVVELSDGERQKVMIARALAQEPALIILDEPTAFLDLPRRVDILRMLRNLARETGRAMLLSTHDLDLAIRGADRLWLLPTGGPLEDGAPEDLVLGGTFEAAFRGEGITFDRASGSFRMHAPSTRQVLLIGSGLAGIWTARALEREGFGLATRDETAVTAQATVQIENDDDCKPTRWRSVTGGEEHTHPTIHDLILYLRRAVPPERHPTDTP